MAKTYTSIDSYVSSMSSYIENAGFGGEGSRIDPDSAMRNYIAEQIQRLEDNDRNISQIQGFYDAVGGLSSEGFGNAWLLDGATEKLGGKELTAIAATMMRLDDMQQDGKITMSEYEGYINRMLCPDGIDAIEGGGNDDIFNMFEDIEHDSARPANEDVRKDNESALSVGTRPYINGRSDYLNSAREARSGDEAYNARRNAEGYDIYSDMDDKLRQAREDGLLTEEQYADAKAGLRDFQRTGTTFPDSRDAVLFAMEDALASGDPALAAKVMSSDGISGISGFTGISSDGVGLLREVARANVFPGMHGPIVPEAPDVHPGEIGPSTEPETTPEPLPVAGFDDLPNADVGARELADVMDAMGASYFERSEENGGISLEQYSSMSEEYEGMEDGAKKQAYLTLHPDFAEANAYMAKLDALEEGAMSGRLYINVTTDADGKATYGISYPDDRTEKPEFPDGIRILDGTSVRPGDPSFLAQAGDIMPTLGDRITGAFTLPDNDAERARNEFGDDFLADLNSAVNTYRDPDYEAGPKQAQDEGPSTYEDGDPAIDFDASLSGVDVGILTRQSPEEQLRELQGVAIDIWAGKLGNGEERRAALEEMGYDEEARSMIVNMVNQGQEWCESAGTAEFDRLFPDPGGASLADREAEFQASRSAAAAAVMTYEDPHDFLVAWEVVNGTALTGEDMSAEQATELYDRAAHVLDDGGLAAYAASEGMDQKTLDESGGNLMSYVAENPDAGFSQPDIDDGQPCCNTQEAEPEAQNDEYVPGA